MSAHERIVGSR